MQSLVAAEQPRSTKGETRCADAEDKTMDAFHFHVRASPCPGLLAFLWAIGLLYLQLTYMGLDPLNSRALCHRTARTPLGPGLSTVASSSASQVGGLPRIDCPKCKIQVIRRKSKAGNMYYTCPNNFLVIYLAFPLMLGSMFVQLQIVLSGLGF